MHSKCMELLKCYTLIMTIALGTPNRYLEAKIEAIKEALKKLGIEAEITDKSFSPQYSQTLGFEELIKKSKKYAAETLKDQNFDVGVGIENALSFIYSANEWYYVICVAILTKDGKEAVSFTPGIMVPQWMIQEVQKDNIELDALTERLAKEDDPVLYFSGGTLTRKELMMPALLLAFSKLGMGKHS